MASIPTIRSFNNTYVGNYAVSAFHEMRMNRLINMILDYLSSGGGGGTVTGVTYEVTGANFTSTVDCPIPALDGISICVFWNDASRYLVNGVDFTDLVGGGFTVLVGGIPGFDATGANLTSRFFVTQKG